MMRAKDNYTKDASGQFVWPSLEQRLASATGPKDDATGCIPWIGAKDSSGYGHIAPRGSRKVKAHRLIYSRAHGKIPANMYVCHKCDNPSCININHLFLGTHAENMADMGRKGRAHKAFWNKNGARLTWEIVTEIRRRHSAGARQCDLAVAYDISPASVCMMVNFQTWKIPE